MIPVIKWTLWQRRWSIFWWSVGNSSFIFLEMVFYPSFRDQAEQLRKTLDNLPHAATQFFGGSDLVSPVGFTNGRIFFLMLPLLLGILAIGLGSSLIAREEQDKTIEAVLARPISRSRLLLAKSVAGILVVSIVTALSLTTLLILAAAVKLEISTLYLIVATVFCWVLAICFGAIALLFTAVGRARGASLGIATAIAFGGYIIDSLTSSVDWLKYPAKLFPFHYYKSEPILYGHFNWTNLLVLLAIIIGCGAISWLAFCRRDLS